MLGIVFLSTYVKEGTFFAWEIITESDMAEGTDIVSKAEFFYSHDLFHMASAASLAEASFTYLPKAESPL